MGKMKRTVSILMTLAVMVTCICIPSIESNAAGITLSGTAHVQTYADMAAKVVNENGTDTLVLGTRGQAKRVESVTINLKNNTGYSGTIEYRVHRQTYGWTEWAQAGMPAGTTGEAKRLEAIEIRLTGELAKHYDVRYAAHAQTYGDNQGWVYNGALAGTTGEAKRLEEIKIQIIPKGTYNEQVSYRVHRQTYGWESIWSYDGMISGTTGQAKRLEGITIDLKGNKYSGGITYRTHVQSYGWLDWVSDGEMSGTQGEAKRLEAIEIKLTGDAAKYYDVYYRVHAQKFGWMGWVSNGAPAGTSGYGYRLEAIQIKLVKKGAAAPAEQGQSAGYSDKEDSQEQTPSGSSTPSEDEKPAEEQKPVWHEPQYQTVTEIKCTDCGSIFRTREDIQNHFIEYEYDNCDGDYTETKKSYLVQDGYNEYSQQGRTYVPAKYTVQWVVYEEAWIERDVPVYETRYYDRCNQCKEKFYVGESETQRMLKHFKERKECWSYSTGFTEQVQVGTKDVIHPELGRWQKVLVHADYWK